MKESNKNDSFTSKVSSTSSNSSNNSSSSNQLHPPPATTIITSSSSSSEMNGGSNNQVITRVSEWFDADSYKVFMRTVRSGDILEVRSARSSHWGIAIRLRQPPSPPKGNNGSRKWDKVALKNNPTTNFFHPCPVALLLAFHVNKRVLSFIYAAT